MKIMFLHGLEGSPQGTKASYLQEKYGAYVPELDMSELKGLKKSNGGSWALVDRYDVLWASRVPMKQTREAIEQFCPDMVIGSSMGGAILAKMAVENAWSGPSIFLASASKLMYGISKVPLPLGQKSVWIHGSSDDIIPVDDSLEIAKASGGCTEIVDDGHRLEKIIDLGSLDEAIHKLEKYIERTMEESLG